MIDLQEATQPTGLTRRSWLAGAGGLALSPVLAGAAAAEGAEAIAVSARRIAAFDPRDPSRKRFGGLTFRGGLILRSNSADFGGLSGLARPGDGGRLIAVTDRGRWFTAHVVSEGGAPVGLESAVLTPMLSASGRPLPRTRSADTEGLCIADGVAYVSVERRHAILRFDWARRGTAARAQPLAMPDVLRDLPSNRGLEALGLAPAGSPVAGAIVAIAERSGGHDEPTLGVIAGRGRSETFRYQLEDGYEVTDLAFLPGGDMLVLERWYRAWRGVGVRLRRVAAARLQPGAVILGQTLMEADLAQEIDNMEGLSVHREGGRTILTLISDDNFSRLQRTVLLEFELPG